MSRSHFILISAPAIGRRCRFGSLPRVFLAVICLGAPLSLRAQAPDAATYPVDPAAAAGMTRGLPNGVTGQQAEMMQVRTSAQGAQGEAAAAMMARSADQSIEERNQEIALQTAREKKSIKESMTERLRFERASASYNKVSANDMSTWKTEGGGVRVERNVPDAFLMSLIEEEEQAEALRAELAALQQELRQAREVWTQKPSPPHTRTHTSHVYRACCEACFAFQGLVYSFA